MTVVVRGDISDLNASNIWMVCRLDILTVDIDNPHKEDSVEWNYAVRSLYQAYTDECRIQRVLRGKSELDRLREKGL